MKIINPMVSLSKKIAQNEIRKNKDYEVVCTVMAYDSTSSKATVDLNSDGIPVYSQIPVIAGDKVRVRIKNGNNIAIIAKA